MNIVAYKFAAPDGSYWYIDASDRQTYDYWNDRRKLIPLHDDKARAFALLNSARLPPSDKSKTPNVNSTATPT